MSMNVSATSENYSNYSTSSASTLSAKESANVDNKEVSTEGATFTKTEDSKKATYSVNKMSQEERANLVSQLKADQENRLNQLTQLVSEMLGGQAKSFANANDMWKVLASGDFTVDAATKAQAQADIAEDGYWGVSQTSQRLFDFASALAGDDVDKMKEMQEAMMKGFKLATDTWGKELPQISRDTIDAANKLFEDYYASKESAI